MNEWSNPLEFRKDEGIYMAKFYGNDVLATWEAVLEFILVQPEISEKYVLKTSKMTFKPFLM